MITAADGLDLRFAFWPAVGAPRGSILLAQGRSEYIEKAYEWIGKFQARGLNVGAFDFRGQGLSQRLLENRRRGYIDDFKHFQTDYDAAFAAMRGKINDAPLIVCGHSMGGLATKRFLSRQQAQVDGAILSAPMLGLAIPAPISFLARLSSTAATALGYGQRYVYGCDHRSGAERGFTDNVLTSDATRFARHQAILAANPDLVLGGTTHGWLRAAYREMSAVAALPAGWLDIPVLALSAGEDTVVSNAAIERFVSRNPMAIHAPIPGSRHEPLMEVEAVQKVVWPIIDRYLDDVLSAKNVKTNHRQSKT